MSWYNGKYTRQEEFFMKERILIVDDEKEIADLLELYLTNDGFTVTKCYAGLAARECIRKECFDLAILDVMLPEVNGFTLCQEIRKKDLYPIIMLTAKDAEIDKITGLTLGADDYITKPFLPLEVVARVKAQIRRYKRYDAGIPETSLAVEEELLFCGDVSLDEKGHQVFCGEKEIKLTPTEFTILKVLFEHKGEVVGAEELFHAVWADEYYCKGNNTVSVHIRHIREKLGDTGERPKYIHTVWGVGYKADA